MADAELFVLNQGWGEAAIRETTGFEPESESGFKKWADCGRKRALFVTSKSEGVG